MPVLEAQPKWIIKSRAFIGVFIMLLSTIFGDGGLISIEAITNVLNGIVQNGAFSIGAILSIVGTAVRKRTITLWPPKTEG